MPGYMMHLAEGQIILDKLNQTKNNLHISKNDFLLGCMLPDAVTDKELTHFRPANQKKQITKYPDMPYVLNTHLKHPLSSCDFGILAHLHMDAIYVTDFWPKYFTFLDTDESYTNITSDIDHVWIQTIGQHVPFKQFFTDTWFYGEYDILNPYIKSVIHISIPEITTLPKDIHIYDYDCIDRGLLETMLAKLSEEINTVDHFSSNLESKSNIFPKEDILNFLDETADLFIKEILLL